MEKQIIAYKGYYQAFMKKLNAKEQDKVRKALLLLRSSERLPYHYIKHLRDGLYELRVSLGNNALRLFFIYDGDKIIVLFNGFRKKTQKTPKQEIDKALRLKKEYYEQR
ncbi:MAG: type II toxin-antitoxin system RelE/ParE family toxin [Gammaproteobacteria bacterium]|nr:type II toxin-antitoxin system RelE/ParE family toxin [Gammaproteobacteria bacterium]